MEGYVGELAGCRSFPNEACLLAEGRDEGTCVVCRSIVSWEKSGAKYILVREICAGRGLYVFSVSRPAPTAEDREKCVLELRIADSSLREIRQAVNTYLLASEESWIDAPEGCIRVR